MATVLAPTPAARGISDPDVLHQVNGLRRPDNVTNWFYLAREHLFLGTVAGLAVACYQHQSAHGVGWGWNVLVSLVAIVLIGAGQHRLATLAHEASHYVLFRNRLLNDLASDWLCMFPLWSITHNFRLQHLAHHQFVNDPARDPDVAQLQESGHRFHFPMPPRRFLWECVVKQFLWLPNLVRYVRVRGRYAAAAHGTGPYRLKAKASPILMAAGFAYLASLVSALTLLVRHGDPAFLAVVPAGLWAAAMVFYGLAPRRWYPENTVKPVVTPRCWTMGRLTYATLAFTSLAWLTYATGQPWALYYAVLWLVPTATTYAFFMLLRQVVQHGNTGSERLTNTRVFFVGTFVRFAVFPLGMDYHLPHHLFPMVPHYRLKELHTLLMETEEYRHEVRVVDGYFFHHERPAVHPTVLELMAR